MAKHKKIKAKKPKKVKKLVKVSKHKAKPSKAKEPAVSKPAVLDWDRAIAVLAKRAEARGFLTEAEVMHALPELETNIAAVEKLLDMLDSKGLELVEQEMASV